MLFLYSRPAIMFEWWACLSCGMRVLVDPAKGRSEDFAREHPACA